MKSTNKLIKIPIFLFFLLSSYFVVGQCPTTAIFSQNHHCITLTWSTLPSPYPTSITISPGGTYTLSGATGQNPAIFTDGQSCGNGTDNTPGAFTITINGTVCTYNNGTLPLNLLDFNSATYDNSILVSWKCIENEKCLGYELEKSYDGIQWSVLTFPIECNTK